MILGYAYGKGVLLPLRQGLRLDVWVPSMEGHWNTNSVCWLKVPSSAIGGRDKRFSFNLQGRNLSSIHSTDQDPAISHMWLEAKTVNNLYTNLELCRIPPDFLLSIFSFLGVLHFIKIRFLLAKIYSQTEQSHSQIDTYKYVCLLRVTMVGLLVLKRIF